MTSSQCRVLIVDDMPQVRRDLGVLLGLTPHLTVVGDAADGSEAILLTEKLCPDIVVMDLQMPGLDGSAATRQIKDRCPGCRVVILSVYSDSESRARAHAAGADAFVSKTESLQKILDVITNLASPKPVKAPPPNEPQERNRT